MSYNLKPLYDDVRTISTRDEAKKWLGHLMDRLSDARMACNVVVPDDHNATVKAQQSAERKYLVHYGTFMGVLRSLHATGHVDDGFYATMHQQAGATLGATVVGRA